MYEKSIDIIVFSGDSDFFDEIKVLLDIVGIRSIMSIDSIKEAAGLISRSDAKVIIYDSLYGNNETRKLIHSRICSSDNTYCIYVCERRDEELFGGNQPKIIRLNRPYSTQCFYETVLHLTYNLRNLNKPINNNNAKLIDRTPIAVTDILQKIGIPAHIKGFAYLRYSVITVTNEPEMINLITKNLYLTIANEYQTTGVCVERAIRHAIDIAWERGNIMMLNTHFGSLVKSKHGRPSNSEFIAVASNIIREKLQIIK